MRGSIRKWMVVGALTSAALLAAGCTNTRRDTEGGIQDQTGMGGSGGTGDISLGEQGIGGAGGTHARDAGTALDAGTGGAGLDDQGLDTQERGGTGGSEMDDTGNESGGIRSPNLPQMDPGRAQPQER